jgi:hypothetical protein
MTNHQLIAMFFPVLAGGAAVAAGYIGIKFIAPQPVEEPVRAPDADYVTKTATGVNVAAESPVVNPGMFKQGGGFIVGEAFVARSPTGVVENLYGTRADTIDAARRLGNPLERAHEAIREAEAIAALIQRSIDITKVKS